MTLVQYYNQAKVNADSLMDAAGRLLSRGQVGSAISNHDACLIALKCQALIEWRHSFADPRVAMRRAIGVAVRAHELVAPFLLPRIGAPLTDGGQADPAAAFHFGAAELICFLLNEGPRDKFSTFAAVRDSLSRRNIVGNTFNAMDTALSRFFKDQVRGSGWEQLRSGVPAKRSWQLLRETVELYDALAGAIERREAEKIPALAAVGGTLYEARKDDHYFGSYTYDENGKFSDCMVDHRLGALLLCAERVMPGSTGTVESVHRWKFGG